MRSGRAQTRPDRWVSEVIADALNGSSPLEGFFGSTMRLSALADWTRITPV
jgi:hypothetical protein